MFSHISAIEDSKQFRNAFILKPGFDFSALKPLCGKIIYATDGHGDHLESIRAQLVEAFQKFDPNFDVVVPVGNAVACVIAGQIIRDRVIECSGPEGDYVMGVYLDKEYRFYRIPVSDSYPIEVVLT